MTAKNTLFYFSVINKLNKRNLFIFIFLIKNKYNLKNNNTNT